MPTLRTFTYSRLAMLLALSISFWSSGPFLARALSAYGFWGGYKSAIIFVLAIPVAWLSIRGVKSLLKLTQQEVFPTVLFLVTAVTLLHGIALTYFPSLYGTPPDLLGYAGAAFLWFAGAVLLCASI